MGIGLSAIKPSQCVAESLDLTLFDWRVTEDVTPLLNSLTSHSLDSMLPFISS